MKTFLILCTALLLVGCSYSVGKKLVNEKGVGSIMVLRLVDKR